MFGMKTEVWMKVGDSGKSSVIVQRSPTSNEINVHVAGIMLQRWFMVYWELVSNFTMNVETLHVLQIFRMYFY